MQSLGKFLKQKRIEAKKTQGEIAKELKYSNPQFVSNWERDVAPVPIKKLKKICALYKVNPNEVFVLLVENYKNTLRKVLSITES